MATRARQCADAVTTEAGRLRDAVAAVAAHGFQFEPPHWPNTAPEPPSARTTELEVSRWVQDLRLLHNTLAHVVDELRDEVLSRVRDARRVQQFGQALQDRLDHAIATGSYRELLREVAPARAVEEGGQGRWTGPARAGLAAVRRALHAADRYLDQQTRLAARERRYAQPPGTLRMCGFELFNTFGGAGWYAHYDAAAGADAPYSVASREVAEDGTTVCLEFDRNETTRYHLNGHLGGYRPADVEGHVARAAAIFGAVAEYLQDAPWPAPEPAVEQDCDGAAEGLSP